MSDASDSEDGGWAALEAKKAKSKGKKTEHKTDHKKKGKKGEVKENGIAAAAAAGEKSVDEKSKPVESTAEDTISLEVEDDSADESAEEEIDDQTATLLKGFESSDDEEESGGEELAVGQMAGARIPDEKKTKKKIGALAVRDKVGFEFFLLGFCDFFWGALQSALPPLVIDMMRYKKKID